MHKKDFIVTITRKLPDIIETRLNELFTCHFNYDDTKLSQQELSEAMQKSDVLVPCVTDKITSDMMEQAKSKLKLIASFGTGLDHIDLISARKYNIMVTNTPDVLTEDVADMAMSMICALARRMAEGEQWLRAGKWEGWSPCFMLGSRIWSKKLGIIGMGRIGSAVARRAKGFGIDIHYHNRNRVAKELEDELQASYWSSLDKMLASMDIISIHCPHTPASYHIINERRLSIMPASAIIINTARGEVIDEQALIKALSSGKIAGAALDVYEGEPHINPKLLALPNVLLLPHMASNTFEARVQMGERVIVNIYAFTDGLPPPDQSIQNLF